MKEQVDGRKLFLGFSVLAGMNILPYLNSVFALHQYQEKNQRFNEIDMWSIFALDSVRAFSYVYGLTLLQNEASLGPALGLLTTVGLIGILESMTLIAKTQ